MSIRREQGKPFVHLVVLKIFLLQIQVPDGSSNGVLLVAELVELNYLSKVVFYVEEITIVYEGKELKVSDFCF